MLRRFTFVIWLLASTAYSHAASTLFIEELTWIEVRDAVASGKKTALYYAGSTEQNGPHMATGKHNWIARYVAEQIAKELGNALVYPTLPFAPTGDAMQKTEHMAYAGSVSVSDTVFGVLAKNVAQSALVAGFECVVLMGDHGGGQAALAQTAKEMTAELSRANRYPAIRVVYADAVYERANELAMALLKVRGLPYGDHASIIDTSELLFVRPSAVRMAQRAVAAPANGSSGYAALATAELGKAFIGFKVSAALAQIRSASGCGK